MIKSYVHIFVTFHPPPDGPSKDENSRFSYCPPSALPAEPSDAQAAKRDSEILPPHTPGNSIGGIHHKHPEFHDELAINGVPCTDHGGNGVCGFSHSFHVEWATCGRFTPVFIGKDLFYWIQSTPELQSYTMVEYRESRTDY
ncbi:hypothetical protein RRG08_025329 [Elysia crispata]|uniref:Uncharacterized protein n=1 Tax=Elysia crispata TaxID=231223 RepID=A0AAE1DUM8_9GAST|nr:hypothetical protein RRG08_025329 [Elysia crispata]